MHIAARCPPPRTLSVHTHTQTCSSSYIARRSLHLVHPPPSSTSFPSQSSLPHAAALPPFRLTASTSQHHPRPRLDHASTTPRPRKSLPHARTAHLDTQAAAAPSRISAVHLTTSLPPLSLPRHPHLRVQPPTPLAPSLHHTQADRPCKWASSTHPSLLPSPPTRTQPP